MTITSVVNSISAGAGERGFLHQEPMKLEQSVCSSWAPRGSSPLNPLSIIFPPKAICDFSFLSLMIYS